MTDIYQEILSIISEGKNAALATVVASKGSVPRHPGSRMIVIPDKTIIGTIGGGTLESEVINRALEIIKSREAVLQSYGLIPKDKKGIGMTCGGNVTVFIEPIKGKERLLIVGAGHISVPLAEFANRLGFHVTVAEDRKEFLDKKRFPKADKIQHVPVKNIKKFIDSERLEYVALINRNSACDADWLDAILNKKEAVYVGCIGSRMRVRTVKEQLLKRGLSKTLYENLYSPIGIEIGAESPEEIAISILAEIISVKQKVNVKKRVSK